MLRVANVLIVSTKGDLLMQQRDDNPNINNPGKITSFGGTVEQGETPIEAAVRELEEETGLRVRPSDLDFFDTFRKTMKEHGEDSEVTLFVLAGVDQERMHVYEGKGVYVVHRGDNFDEINFSILAHMYVPLYFKRNKKW